EVLRFQADRVHHDLFVDRAVEHSLEGCSTGRVVSVSEDQNDAPYGDAAEGVQAGGNAVVESRGIPEIELVQLAGQFFAIVRERATQLNLVVEGTDLGPIHREQARNELLCGGLQ